MRSFTYTITDPLGVHARPAGLVAEAAKEYSDTVIAVEKSGNAARANQLMRMMGLGIRQGDVVTVSAEGVREDAAIAAMQEFFRNNL